MSDFKKIKYEVCLGKRYPTYKTESGLDCKGIENTLNKPHGLEELMKSIVKEVQNGSKRFNPLSKKLLNHNSTNDILEAIDILVIDGIIQTKSKNKKPNKSDMEWELQTISLDPRVRELLSPKAESFEDKYQRLLIQVNEIIEKTEHSLLKMHLIQCLNERLLTSPSGEKVCDTEAWVKFKSVALAIAYSIVLLDEDKKESLRVISERIWGKSKILDRYKKDIICVAGKALDQLNLTIMPEITFVYGDVLYSYRGHQSSFLAGRPYCLTEETIKDLEILHVGIDRIFIIENLAVFQDILLREYQYRPDVLLFWGAGYLSSPKIKLLNKVLQYRPIPVYIWSDIDSDGLGLTLDIIKRVRKYNINAIPVLMGAEELDLAKGEYKASNHHNLNEPELFNIFPDVIERIKQQDVMEQEELLLYFNQLKYKLP